MEFWLHFLGTIVWIVAFGALLQLLGLHGYLSGYVVGTFGMMYYYVGLSVLTEKSK